MTGRRWLAASAVALVMAVGASGCSQLPGGVDGELANAWAMPGEPKGYEPVDGACFLTYLIGTASVKSAPPVDCSQPHEAETVYVGDSPGGSEADQFAFCEKKVNAALGRDWRGLRVTFEVILPTVAAIKAGAKWIRCDVREVRDIEQEMAATRTGRLKDGLDALALGCFQASGKDYTLTAVACGQKHNAEYVGSVTGTGSKLPETDSQWAPIHDRCAVLLAAFLGVSISQYAGKYSGLAGVVSNDWDKGERGVRCFLYLGKTKMTGSAKGKKLAPPRYS
ncbi:MAG: septum formation family protein [Hamadaea sp.]|uniref:septum formation family protein n=1 Tax=Hamadaea sp. TaxID=2024425 RepID=UPI001820659C|nr:septum formation family protein [Hamadaea sp.]NUR69352.1 septum formation family protein [Hamadaea sp.]NUT18276.1 septum formation family protein [Hamadaea sp.]